ncbi:GPW/gp25 family protein [Polycladidibacter hongkongensis]|uniref:GPW/gp25 family protein n=1 Tax=Polycladidibacter hongkongensis TaxID=1647556 RepID=UPI0008314CE1|nr:GPW/gp25 family protein [Pseudovibrio hongkongensis]
MAGIDMRTRKPIGSLESALQGVEVIFSTERFSRVMRRFFGAGLPQLLGRRLSPKLFAAFSQLAVVAIGHWEPRFKVRRATIKPDVEGARRGEITLMIEADFRPRAHLAPPDYRVERTVNFGLTLSDEGAAAQQL